MTNKEIVDAVIASRFSANDRTQAQRWVNQVARTLWTSAALRWVFTESDLTALTLTANQQYAVFPAALREVENVYTDQGETALHLPRDEFEQRYLSAMVTGTVERGRPRIWATWNRRVYLFPQPDSAYPFQCTGRLVWGHDDGTGVFVAGDMSVDTDKPWWPDHHDVLVVGAKMAGKTEREDPTYQQLAGEFQALELAMIADLAEPHGISSYGMRDPL